METLFLACFICLQLTNPFPDHNPSVFYKRDSPCHQCLTGLFDPPELAPYAETQQDQTIGELLASNHALQKALEERLIQKLSKRPSQTKNEHKEEPKPTTIPEYELTIPVIEGEDILYETFSSQPMWNVGEVASEFLVDRKKSENLIEQALIAKDNVQVEEENSQRNILKNGARLMAGESLVSENGRFKATLQNHAQLLIIDQQNNNEVIKEIGDQSKFANGPGVHMIMQSDGNLVIYSRLVNGSRSHPNWDSRTMDERPGCDKYYLKLENTGQLVIYDEVGYIVWHSGRKKSEWDIEWL